MVLWEQVNIAQVSPLNYRTYSGARQLWCWSEQGSKYWFIPAVPTPLPSAHFRLLLNLAAVQSILVLLQWLSVHSVQSTYTDRYTCVHTHTHTLAQTHTHARTHTHIHAHTHTILPIFSCLLYFPISPSRKMRSLHSWRLLLLTEQMEQSRELVYHTATVAIHSGARHRKTTQALPYGFPHLTLCKDLHSCYIYASGMLRNTCIVLNTVVWVNTRNHFETLFHYLANHIFAKLKSHFA